MKLFCNEWDVLNLLKNWGICRWNFRETIWVVSRLQGASNYFIVQVLVPWRLFDSPCWCCSFIRCSWRLARSTTPHFRTLPKYSECNLFFHGKSSRPHAHCDRIGQAVLEMAELARTRFNFVTFQSFFFSLVNIKCILHILSSTVHNTIEKGQNQGEKSMNCLVLP